VFIDVVREFSLSGEKGPVEEVEMSDLERLIAQGIRAARRVIIGVIGSTVIVVGVALLVLPGPAFVVLPIGFGILAIEFEWARRLMRRVKGLYKTAKRTSSPAGSEENSLAESRRGPDGSREITRER
jgi:hypothetical protein